MESEGELFSKVARHESKSVRIIDFLLLVSGDVECTSPADRGAFMMTFVPAIRDDWAGVITTCCKSSLFSSEVLAEDECMVMRSMSEFSVFSASEVPEPAMLSKPFEKSL